MNIVTYITPINLAREKDKFFSSRFHNPILEYDWENPKLTEWTNKKNNKYRQMITALHNQDYRQVTELASKVFHVSLEASVLREAKDILQSKPDLLPKQDYNKIQAEFEKVFKYFSLDYKLKMLDTHGFNFRPIYKEKAIYMSKYAVLDFFTIDGEVRHEVSHIIRRENTYFNSIVKTHNSLAVGEGLACYFQDFCSEGGLNSLYQHSAEYAVTDIAVKGTFRDMYDFFRDLGFSAELAWHRGIRHKYGFIDTSEPGDIMKPGMYFYNEMKIKNLNDNERLRLMTGKISIEDLDNYPEYKGMFSAEKLEEYFMKRQ